MVSVDGVSGGSRCLSVQLISGSDLCLGIQDRGLRRGGDQDLGETPGEEIQIWRSTNHAKGTLTSRWECQLAQDKSSGQDQRKAGRSGAVQTGERSGRAFVYILKECHLFGFLFHEILWCLARLFTFPFLGSEGMR